MFLRQYANEINGRARLFKRFSGKKLENYSPTRKKLENYSPTQLECCMGVQMRILDSV